MSCWIRTYIKVRRKLIHKRTLIHKLIHKSTLYTKTYILAKKVRTFTNLTHVHTYITGVFSYLSHTYLIPTSQHTPAKNKHMNTNYSINTATKNRQTHSRLVSECLSTENINFASGMSSKQELWDESSYSTIFYNEPL